MIITFLEGFGQCIQKPNSTLQKVVVVGRFGEECIAHLFRLD